MSYQARRLRRFFRASILWQESTLITVEYERDADTLKLMVNAAGVATLRVNPGTKLAYTTFPIRVTVVPTDGAPLLEVSALTQDLNPSGMAFRSSTPIPGGSKVTLPLALASGTVQVSGEVLRVSSEDTQGETVYTHGVRFDQLPFETRDAIELHCAHHSIPMLRMRYRQSTNFLTRAAEVVGNIRGEKRYKVQLPAEVSVAAEGDSPAEAGLALLEDVSPHGARLLMETPVKPGRRISFEVPGTSLSGQGTVIFNRTLESPLRVRFVVGIIRDPKQSWLKAWAREWRALGEATGDQPSARDI